MKIFEILKLGLILAVFSAAACIMLAFVYTATSPIIALRQYKELRLVLAEFFPEADDFETIPLEDITSPYPAVTIEVAYAAIKNGLPFAAALRVVSHAGYSGPIRTMVGVNSGGYIVGVNIMEHTETPGLGALAASSNYFVDRANRITFYGQFAGKRVSDPFVVRQDVHVITASTITSRAVADSVRAAGLAVNTWLETQQTAAAGRQGE